jgi:hypothetical protein
MNTRTGGNRGGGARAGSTQKRDTYRRTLAYHEHDGQPCQGYHADTKCAVCGTAWAMSSWTICVRCFDARTPTHYPDGRMVPITVSNEALRQVREEYAA